MKRRNWKAIIAAWAAAALIFTGNGANAFAYMPKGRRMPMPIQHQDELQEKEKPRGRSERPPEDEEDAESRRSSRRAQEDEEAGGRQTARKSDWTVMVYLCGGSLESAAGLASAQLSSIARTAPEEGVKLLIQTGGAKKWQAGTGAEADTEGGAGLRPRPDKIQRYAYDAEGFKLLEESVLQNMASAETLADFLSWGAKECPAEKYMLLLWDRGAASPGTLLQDEYFHAGLNAADLGDALEKSGLRMELMVLDSPHTASLETASALSPYAEYLAAYEGDAAGQADAWAEWLQYLYDAPDCDGKECGQAFLEAVQESCEGNGKLPGALLAASLIDLSEIPDVEEAFSRYCQGRGELLEDAEAFHAFSAKALEAESFGLDGEDRPGSFGGGKFCDLGDLASRGRKDEKLSAESVALYRAVRNAVVSLEKGEGRSRATGLSYLDGAALPASALDRYARYSGSAAYLAYLDAIHPDWTAPEWVYEETDPLPEAAYEAYFPEAALSAPAGGKGQGTLRLDITNAASSVTTVEPVFYRFDEKRESWQRLGKGGALDASDEEEGAYLLDFDGTWPCIEGEPCPLFQVGNLSSGNRILEIPAVLEGRDLDAPAQRMALYALAVPENAGGQKGKQGKREEGGISAAASGLSYELYGISLDADASSSLPLSSLEDAEIRLLYPAVDALNDTWMYQGGETRFDGDGLRIEEDALPDGRYAVSFLITGAFGTAQESERAILEWDGKKAVFVQYGGEEDAYAGRGESRSAAKAEGDQAESSGSRRSIGGSTDSKEEDSGKRGSNPASGSGSTDESSSKGNSSKDSSSSKGSASSSNSESKRPSDDASSSKRSSNDSSSNNSAKDSRSSNDSSSDNSAKGSRSDSGSPASGSTDESSTKGNSSQGNAAGDRQSAGEKAGSGAESDAESNAESSSGKSPRADAGSSTGTASARSDSETGPGVTRKNSDGWPWIDSDLQANLDKDRKVSEKDDFHLASNFAWLTDARIQVGDGAPSPYDEVQAETLRRARALLRDKNLEGHDAALVQDLYNAFLDWDQRNALGMEPVMSQAEDIMALDSMDALSEFICDLERSYGVPTFYYCLNTQSYDDASAYITAIYNDGFILGDAAEYAERSTIGDLYYAANKKQAVALLVRLGFAEKDAEKLFDRVIDFEGELASAALTSDEYMRPDIYEKVNNVYTPQELYALSENFPMEAFMKCTGYEDAKQFLLYEPELLARLDKLYTKENLDNIKAYMLVRYLLAMGSCLDREAYDQAAEAYNMIWGFSGTKTDSEAAYNIVNSLLYEPLERLYLERYDATETKEKISELCSEVVAVYRKMLEGEEWLSDETRKRAVSKLDNMQINAVYPDKWNDYSGLDLTGLSYADCLMEISRFQMDLDRAKTNQKVDRGMWCDIPILQCNAYYMSQQNSINILLGLLGGSIYNDDMSEEELYGSIGAIIAHEISHAFDTSGAQFDENGNMSDWWTEQDFQEFRKRAKKLAEYYDGIIAFDGQHVDGEQIQTEAIADMAGIKAMLAIAEEKEDFDYDAFFRQYAGMWRTAETKETEYFILAQDSHPLNYLRTNVTLQQFDIFLETYGIEEGDGMYLAPEDRILLW